MMKTTLDNIYTNDDHLMFGERINDADLSALHPAPAQLFKLWQIYQENVDPLLKVTHGPSLQARIVDAMGSLQTIDPTLEALLFSVYSMAILSIDRASCYAMFGAAQDDLLSGYQFGCQQALLSCGVFKSNDREGLTALFLYLVGGRKGFPRYMCTLLTALDLCKTSDRSSHPISDARHGSQACPAYRHPR